jgi:DNA-binding response OmpR family regulator
MAKKVILVIDDDESVCAIIKEGLQQLGKYKVIAAHNGKDGIQLAKKSQPDIILLDIEMPIMNGFQALELLKEDAETYSIPVVMLTGQRSEESKIAASQLYSEEYLTKPIRVAALEARIDAILTRLGY